MRKLLSVATLEKWLKDPDWHVRQAAMTACNGRTDIPVATLEKGLKDPDCDVRQAAMTACNGRTDIPVATLEKWLKDPDWHVRAAAMKSCEGRTDIPVATLEKWLKDPDWHVRAAAMKSCEGRTDIPVATLEKGLKDPDWHVRQAAMNAYKSIGLSVPIIRTIEPPKTVYKKCLCGVIVCASIPDDAQVRGSFGNKCRASQAKITNVIGSFAGEGVGISQYDPKTTYFVGDDVDISDFDYSDEECSQGFHFFCTKKEAENY